jgi:hypothetical protein
MGTISADNIVNQLKNVWPTLKEIWCFDSQYKMVSFNEFDEWISSRWLDIESITAENPDCDDYALQQHAIVKREINLAFGEAFGTKFEGISVYHSLNVVICYEGPYLVDPKKRIIWTPSASMDNVLWVRM